MYREYFTEKGIKENKLYPGIREGLTALKEKGFRLGIASSKPEVFVEQIARDFQITEYFDVMAGSLLDGGRTDKAQVIEEALRRLGAFPEQTVMVGDREHDVKGAARLGIPCAANVGAPQVAYKETSHCNASASFLYRAFCFGKRPSTSQDRMVLYETPTMLASSC